VATIPPARLGPACVHQAATATLISPIHRGNRNLRSSSPSIPANKGRHFCFHEPLPGPRDVETKERKTLSTSAKMWREGSGLACSGINSRSSTKKLLSCLVYQAYVAKPVGPM
jgi:hypothetical protein